MLNLRIKCFLALNMSNVRWFRLSDTRHFDNIVGLCLSLKWHVIVKIIDVVLSTTQPPTPFALTSPNTYLYGGNHAWHQLHDQIITLVSSKVESLALYVFLSKTLYRHSISLLSHSFPYPCYQHVLWVHLYICYICNVEHVMICNALFFFSWLGKAYSNMDWPLKRYKWTIRFKTCFGLV